MKEVIRVANEKNLVRDKKTNAILNTDSRGLELYRAQRTARKSDRQRVDVLEKDVCEIKTMLSEILKAVAK